jgi:hypothetical protein
MRADMSLPKLLLTALLIAFAAPLAAAPYAPQEFDFSGLESTVGLQYGLVENIQPAQPGEPIHVDVFEHSVRSGTAKRFVIRLDSGAGISIVQDGLEQLEPGQRVQVFVRGGAVRAEPADLEP